jgi:hypothetical protein
MLNNKELQILAKKNGNIITIAESNAHIVGTGSATLVLPMGTQIFVKDALLYPDSKRTVTPQVFNYRH